MANIVTRWIDNRIENKVNDILDNSIELTPVWTDPKWKQARNRAFYMAEGPELLRFFRTRFPKSYLEADVNNFYRVYRGTKIPFIHVNIAQLITETMTHLVFEHIPDIEIVAKKQCKRKQQLIEDLEKAIKINELLIKACQYESYSGCVAFKPIIDTEFSEFPFFVPYPAEDIEIKEKYGRVSEVIFTDTYEKDKRYYILKSHYGIGYMDFHLYEGNSSRNKANEVPLSTLEETKDLHRVDFICNGKRYNKLMCIYKLNKATGASDYLGCFDEFAKLDEIASNEAGFVRASKLVTYRPENTLSIDARTGRPIPTSDYALDEVILKDNNPDGTRQEVKRDVVTSISNTLDGYRNEFLSTVYNILITAGISPSTVGYDQSGANASGEAIEMREKVSLRTRSEKIKLWIPCLQDMFKFLIELYGCQFNGDVGFIECCEDDIVVTFSEYVSPTFDQKVDLLSKALDANLIDLNSALHRLYPEKCDEDIEKMELRINGQLLDAEDIVNRELRRDDEEPIEVDERQEDDDIEGKDLNTAAMSDVMSDLQGEYKAIKDYEKHADKMEELGYQEVAKVLRDISEEEKAHVGELQEVLNKHDKGYRKATEQGRNEN